MTEEVKKKTKRKKRRLGKKIALGIFIILLLAIIICIPLFRLEHVTVRGNLRYTEKEIKDISLDLSKYNNTLLFCLTKKKIGMDTLPLLDYVETHMVNRNTICLTVHEKVTLGMFRVGDKACCIDNRGEVLEILDYDASKSLGAFYINGLSSKGTVGEIIPEADSQVLNTLSALKNNLEKYGINPNEVDISDTEEGSKTVKNYTLHFGEITIPIGKDESLEEKIRRIKAILPKLEGKIGTLHMERVDSSTENIVFDEQ